MINGEKVIAVITARAGSKGLANKNIRDFAGEPLLARPIVTAKACSWVDRVILSTDSQAYADIGLKYGAEVPFLRSSELAGDNADSVSVLIDLLDRLDDVNDSYGYLLLLEPTSPLTIEKDITAAMEVLAQHPSAESILAVKEVLTEHPAFCVQLNQEQLMSPFSQVDFSKPLRRQELSALYCFAGSFYLSTTQALRSHGRFYHERALGYVMPSWKTHEIDDLADFICAEALYKERYQFEDQE